MDLITATSTIFGPLVARIIGDIWEDYRTGREIRRGVAANAQGYQWQIPNRSGILSIPDVELIQPAEQEPPILLMGEFIADESFAEFTDIILDEEEKKVVLLLADEETADVYYFEFGFDGYEILIWPGNYSFYAFIVDPIFDEVLGFGYPGLDDLSDPNPMVFGGEGTVRIDFFIFDVEELINDE